jgi:hypothetical protein
MGTVQLPGSELARGKNLKIHSAGRKCVASRSLGELQECRIMLTGFRTNIHPLWFRLIVKLPASDLPEFDEKIFFVIWKAH